MRVLISKGEAIYDIYTDSLTSGKASFLAIFGTDPRYDNEHFRTGTLDSSLVGGRPNDLSSQFGRSETDGRCSCAFPFGIPSSVNDTNPPPSVPFPN